MRQYLSICTALLVGACATGFDDVTVKGALTTTGATTHTGAVTASSTLGVTGAATLSSTLDVTGATTLAALVTDTNSITDAATLTAADCGKTHFVTAGIDTKTITLPATVAGCKYEFMYVGADGGALLDISPNASDAVHGSCTLAASVLEFNGTDDNDIGLTKATANTGDTITLIGDGTEGWYVLACAGIWANN